MKSITPTEAAALLAGDNPPRLIDCREADEFEICRIPGARLIPLSRFAEAFSSELTNSDATVVLYCHHGMRSRKAGAFLQARGFTGLFNLDGGIDRWSMEVDPSVPRY